MDNFICLSPGNTIRKLFLFFLVFFSFCEMLNAQAKAPMRISANVQESSCAGTGHLISVKVDGGEKPFTYSWNDGAEGSFRKDLKSGTYICTVRDSKGRAQSKTFVFSPHPSALQLDFDQRKSGDGTYSVSLTAKGGKAPYIYFWIGPGLDPKKPVGKPFLDNLSTGVYQVVVQDANGCTANNTISLK